MGNGENYGFGDDFFSRTVKIFSRLLKGLSQIIRERLQRMQAYFLFGRPKCVRSARCIVPTRCRARQGAVSGGARERGPSSPPASAEPAF